MDALREKKITTDTHVAVALLRYILSGLTPNSSLIGSLVILEHRVRITLRRIIYIRVVQKILDTQENLFYGDCWFP